MTSLLPQARARRLARPLAHRGRRRRVLRRRPPGPRLPHRHEPRRPDPPSPSPDRVDRVDGGLRAGGLGGPAVHHGCDRVEKRDQDSAACVSKFNCIRAAHVANEERSMPPTDRLVSMMGFMVFLWALVPNAPRRKE